METLEQKRARYAWQCVQKHKYTESQRGVVKGLPLLILNGGLIQSLAYLHSKEKEYAEIGNDVIEWLCQQFPDTLSVSYSKFMEQITELDSQKFQAVTQEAMALLKWLRQFVDVATESELA